MLFRSGLLAVLFLLAGRGAPQAAVDPAPYRVGETIRYSIQKMGIKFGQATLSLQGPRTIKGIKTVLIVFNSKGPNFYDQERIYVDPKTFRPILVARDINIFGKKEKIGEDYRGEDIVITKRVGGKVTQDHLPKKGDVDNIYGFIYRYRASGSFKIGDKVDVHLPTKDIAFTLVKTETVDAARKKFTSFYMESDQYKVWFEDGPSKLPLKINGSVGLASTVMTMTEYHK